MQKEYEQERGCGMQAVDMIEALHDSSTSENDVRKCIFYVNIWSGYTIESLLSLKLEL